MDERTRKLIDDLRQRVKILNEDRETLSRTGDDDMYEEDYYQQLGRLEGQAMAYRQVVRDLGGDHA